MGHLERSMKHICINSMHFLLSGILILVQGCQRKTPAEAPKAPAATLKSAIRNPESEIRDERHGPDRGRPVHDGRQG